MASKVFAAKKEEGDKEMAEAQKCLQTGFFKWKPDFNNASKHFQNAATAYRNAKQPELAIKAFLENAKALEQSEFGTPYAIGRCYEMAGNCSLELKKNAQASQYFETASEFCKQANILEKTGELLVSSAKAIQDEDQKRAIKLLFSSISFFEAEEKEIIVVDTYYLLISLLVAAEDYDKAIEVLLRLGTIFENNNQSSNFYKALLYILVINLYTGNSKLFDENLNKFLNNCKGFDKSDEFSLASNLGTAVHSTKEEYTNFLKTQLHNFRETSFARMVRNMKLLENNTTSLEELLNPPPVSLVPKVDVVIGEGDDAFL